MDPSLEKLKNELIKEGDTIAVNIQKISDKTIRKQSMLRYLTGVWESRTDIMRGEYDTPKAQAFCKDIYYAKWGTPWIFGDISDTICYDLTWKQNKVLSKMNGIPQITGPSKKYMKLNGGSNGTNLVLLELPGVAEVIEKEAIYAENNSNEIVTKYKDKINLRTLDRSVIDNLLDFDSSCYSTMQAFKIILTLIFNHVKIDNDEHIAQLSGSIQQWITNMKQVMINSAQGYVFKSEFQFIGENMILKIANNTYSNNELIHEYYVGTLLNELRKDIPNFMFMYGIFKCGLSIPLCSEKGNSNFMVSEYIYGRSMREMIISPGRNFKSVFTAISQICLALQMAYDRYKFTHQDLHLGNIIVSDLRDTKIIKYHIQNGEVYVASDVCAVIIDYGFSVIHNGDEYVKIKKFNRKYMNIEPKPGIDLFKMMTNFISELDVYKNSDSDMLIAIIIQSFATFGIPEEMSRTPYYYPSEYDEILFNLQPYEYLLSLLSLLPDEMLPDIYNYRPEEYVLLGETNCKTIDDAILKMTTLPQNSESCKGDPWKRLYTNWTDKYGNTRYWFDCGKYYFDGTFNVIVFPKGMALYHGSAALSYYNAMYPLGLKYFDTKDNWLDSDDMKFLRKNDVTDSAKEKLIKLKSPIGTGYYGDLSTAVSYSAVGGKCGGNCISAFKLSKDAVFVDLYDPFNIFVLLTFDPSLSEHGKQILAEAYKITGYNNVVDLMTTFGPGFINLPKEMYPLLQQAFNPFKRFILDSERGSLRNPDYLVPKEIIKSVSERGYAGFCNPRSLYTKGKNIGDYRFAELVFGKNVLDYVERDFSNSFDWQYFDTKRLFGEIGKLILDFEKYKTYNVNFHQGDLIQHSVWVALYVQKQFILQTEWVHGIIAKMASLCIISGFLHDIGKGGDLVYHFYDKKDHPEVGFEYMSGLRKYYLDDGSVELDIPKLLQDINISSLFQPLISFLVLSHWEFGDYISKMDDSNINSTAVKYLEKLEQMWTLSGLDIKTRKEAQNVASMAMLISACDIMGSEVFIDKERFDELSEQLSTDPELIINDLNAVLENYTYITNRPKVHRGSENYKKFQIEKKGLSLRRKVLENIDNKYPDNGKNFMEVDEE